MDKVKLYHGSDHIIEKPEFNLGKMNNDYGQGFYCTHDFSLAQEWACKQNKDGYVNCYSLDMEELKILNLLDGQYNILNWIALLLQHRTFHLENDLAIDARDYIINNFSIDLTPYDIVIGYRADDSYFAFAEGFIQNSLSLRGLNKALYLGKLGTQIVLISKKAFDSLLFEGSQKVKSAVYYTRFSKRDTMARETYRKEIKKTKSYKDDIFVLDILREEMKNDDERIQRIIFK